MPASLKHLTNKKINYFSLLARWKDGLYYSAALVKCDKANKKCLVSFEDGSEIWSDNRDLHVQLSLDQFNEDDDIVCCICDDGKSESPNEIIICDICQQGYHQKCHNPPVDSSKIDESDDTSDHKDWICATCSYILRQNDQSKLSKAVDQQQQKQQQPTPKQPSPLKRPPSEPPTPPAPIKKQTVDTETAKADQTTPPKSTAKVKQTPTVQPQQSQKSTVSVVKSSPISSSQTNQKQAPYYPLSNQARATSSSTSTAALASMTASSALVVGSSAGRTKQDLVNQSNRSSQRQRQAAESATVIVTPPTVASLQPPKHAVRKSSVNFTALIRQSALPTATRSTIPSGTAINPQVAAAPIPKAVPATNLTPSVTLTPVSSSQHSQGNKVGQVKTHNVSTTSPVRINPINSCQIHNSSGLVANSQSSVSRATAQVVETRNQNDPTKDNNQVSTSPDLITLVPKESDPLEPGKLVIDQEREINDSESLTLTTIGGQVKSVRDTE